MGIRVDYEADYSQFLKDCEIVEPHVCKNAYEQHCNYVDSEFVGMELEDILNNKFGYREGLAKLKKLNAKFQLGSRKIKYKWDETDGDDMSYERLIDGFSAMRKRDYSKGKGGNGKFITLNVCLCELADVGADELMCRALTALQIIDYLESLRYRVAVHCYTDTYYLGPIEEGGENVSHFHMNIIVKKENEPLIMPLLCTCISPWMFRYHIFKFRYAKFGGGGCGSTLRPTYVDTETELYIRSGECLNERSAREKLEQIEKMYN